MKRPKTKVQKKLERAQRKARYGPKWNEIRKRVYARDGHRCRACGRAGIKLNAHHILLLRVSQTNDERNLVTLCDSCHKIVEEKSIKILKSGGHKIDIIRSTHRWILETRAASRKALMENKDED